MPLAEEPWKNEWDEKSAKDIDKYWATNILEQGLHTVEALACLQYCSVDESILEVGCGTGRIWEVLKQTKIGPYTGVDLSPAMLDVFRSRAPHVNLVQASATELPFEDNKFDVVICLEVIRHITSYEAAIKELYRVAKKFAIFNVEVTAGKSVYKSEDNHGSYLKGQKDVHYQIEHNSEEFLEWLGREFNCSIDLCILGDSKWMFVLNKQSRALAWRILPVDGMTRLLASCVNILASVGEIMKDNGIKMKLKVDTVVASLQPLALKFVSDVNVEKEDGKGM